MKHFVIATLLFLVSACASNPPALVLDRTAPVADGASRAAKSKALVNADNKLNKNANNKDWRPDYHVVKKGDTLISLGLQYGYYYKDIAAANNIESPFIIKIGQIINLSSINGKTNDSANSKNKVKATEEGEGVVLTPLSSNTVTGSEVKSPTNSPAEIKSNVATKSNNKNTAIGLKPAVVPILSEPKAVREPYSLAAMNRVEPVSNKQNTKQIAENLAVKPLDTKDTLESKGNEVKPTATKPIESSKIDTKSVNANEANPDLAKDVTTGEVLTEPSSKPNDVKPVDAQTVQWSWPTKGKVIANFNEATNKGLDIGGTTGQAINAASAGKVIYSGSDLRGYGKLVIIKHDKTFLSVYAHNSKIIVKEGQSVASGQKIAEMGDTDSDTVKLHFEIRRLGKSVNPALYLN